MNQLSRKDPGNVVLAARQSEKERKYWLNKLTGPLIESRFPSDKKEMKTDSTKMDEVNFEITGQLFAKISWIINESDNLLHIILLSVVNVLLHKYTGNTDIITGTPIYKQDIEGDFVNTILILRNQLEKSMSFKSLLFQVRETLNEAVEHQNYPLEGIFYDLGLPLNKNECQLFNTMIVLENIQSHEYIDHVNRDILFSFLKTGETLKGTIQYKTHLFETNTIQRLLSNLLHLMRQVLFNADMPLSEADAVTEEEKNKLLNVFNDNTMAYSSEKTIIDLFEEQVEKSPDRTAAVYEDQKITYRNLNIKANRLAWLLRSNNVQPNNIVGFISQRSIEMIIGILGILKSGAAYLPIDPSSPTNRLLSLLKNTAPTHFVLTNETIEKHTYMAFLNRASTQVKFLKTPPRPPIYELDLLPLPDRSLVDYEIYNRYIGQALAKNKIVLQGSRGCPYNCAFCHKIWPKKQLSRSAENIFKEINLYYDMGVRRFAFVDDIFNLNIANTSKLFTLLIENNLQVELFLALRGDILTPEYIDLMVRAGTVRLTMSLETASERLQKLIGKNLNLEKFRKNIEYVCTKYPQVILELNTLHGIPTETPEEAGMTLDFIKSLKWIHFPYVHVLKIYQNTDMEKIALRNGISKEAIINSENLAYHELPETLPFDKSFSKNYQADFFNNYFLAKERLIHVLPHQMKILTEDEIVQKYQSYVPADINSLDDLLSYAGIRKDELTITECRPEDQIRIPDFNYKLQQAFPKITPANNALKVLLLDLSQIFSSHKKMLYDIFEPPLGLIYLMSYLNHRLPGKINGKIAKSRVDFNNYTELKTLLDDFKPDVIGVRTLSFFKDFFHRTIGIIRQWGFQVPIIAGGPYITSDYLTVLDDRNIDLLVPGEGEITFFEIIEKIKENNGKLPPIEILKEIQGIVLPTPTLAEKSNSTGPRILLMDEAIEDTRPPTLPGHNPSKLNQPDDLSYIIFTSGSTGKPNGVMIRHQSVNNLTAGLLERIYKQYQPGLNISLVAPYIFDASIKQIFGALLLGHTLYIVPEDTRTDGVRLRDFLKKHQVEILDGTPTHLRMLKEIIGDGNPGFSPRHFVIGGEPFPRTLAEQMFAIFNKDGHTCKITNVYGPTECCDVVATFEIIPGDISPYEILPLGKPMPNSQIYILDLQDRLLPLGAPGELCISGDGPAKGYVNRPELTQEKFSSHPFTKGRPLYKSGDLARWLSNGNIEFLGRKDQQIKIRGFRIEPGEIEKQLLFVENIKESIVVGKKDGRGETLLCAYIVPRHQINTRNIDTINQPFPFEKIIKKHSEFTIKDLDPGCDLSIADDLLNIEQGRRSGSSFFIKNFMAVAQEKRNEIAVKTGTKSLTFKDLDNQSNRLANFIDTTYDDRFKLSKEEYSRYTRQLLLDQWGVECQEKLKSTRVFIAGAGGIGSQIIYQLALLGFGTIIICDDDTVELSNLNRQTMHDLSRVGMNKALSAQMTVRRINPHVNVVVRQERINWNNIDELVGDSQVIFDCVDDLETKFILSGAAVARQIPHVLSGMMEINSFAAILHAPQTACFHCIYDRSKVDEINEMKKTVANYQKKPFPVAAPALFVTTGFVCNEVLKIILGFENAAYNKFFVFNQIGSTRLVETEGYKQMTFAFNDHLKKISREQGFDWEIGWSGKFIEELTIGPDPNCPLCAKSRQTGIVSRQETAGIKITPAMDYDNEAKTQPSVAVMLTQDIGQITTLLGVLKSGKIYVNLETTLPGKKLAYIVEDIGSRLILTDRENLDHALKIRDLVNKRIPVIDIHEIINNENILADSPDIDIIPDDGAYLLPKYDAGGRDVQLTPTELRGFLSKELPEYMIPNYFIEIEKIPFTVNGKLDIAALPEPKLDQTAGNYEVPQGTTEKKLAGIWSEVLAIDIGLIGMHSHFFDLGGHSLRATSLIAKINKELKVKIPLVEVFRSPTLKGLAEFITHCQKENFIDIDDDNLVLLKMNAKDALNLFFIHDISGTINNYMELSNHLTNELNYWGIRINLDEYHTPKNQSIQDIAADYIRKIKKVQPQGPYYIAGWSLGGTIAFEIVHQLEKMNDAIAFFSLIDSIGPRGVLKSDAQPFTAEAEKNFITQYLPDDTLNKKISGAENLAQIWTLITGYMEKNPAGIEIIKKEIEKYINPGMINYERLEPNQIIKYFNMYRTLINSWALYKPDVKIAAAIHYFSAVKSKEIIKDRWDAYSEKPVTTYDIDGDHFSIFRTPGIITLAEKFINALQISKK
ncbi:MAG: AMP-binding protein [Acidobacteria bacterium]|nr:AMP-binding protein [Acidobacteriota bacterium]